MIQVICKCEAYTYNVYHIVKAFYPSETVDVKVEEEASNYVTVSLFERERIVISEADIGPAYIAAGSDTREIKYRVDVVLYRRLEKITGQSLSWGILTGVRPVKIAMKKLKEGMDRDAFIRWFMEDSLVSREKAALAFEVAEREKALLDRLDCEDGYSLYAGVPFCPSVCTYCSFSSGSVKEWGGRIEEYLEALMKELYYISQASAHKRVNAIYIGGGTPTTLSALQLERLLRFIEEHFPMDSLLEYTVEAGRPDSITREKLEVLKAHKVTRISINPQSMQQKTLDIIGRGHTVQEVVEVFCMAREMGFDNINMDIIAGLPLETEADMEDTLAQIEKLAPDSLTVHSLAIKRAARMGQTVRGNGYIEALRAGKGKPDECLSGMIEMAASSAAGMGLWPYYLYRQKNIAGNFENVGYAKVDKAGIYNILIMEEIQSIIAAGAGASTKIVLKEPVALKDSKRKKETNLIRIENVKAIDAYIGRIDEMIERKGEWLWH